MTHATPTHLSVPCPYCGAKVGEKCKATYSGHWTKVHDARDRAVREKAQDNKPCMD